MMGTAAKGYVLWGAMMLCGPVLADVSKPAFVAGEWVRLSGAEIERVLDDRTLIYENAKQTFYKSGKTLYNAGHPSWGNWRIQGDEYCSQWPPNDGWDCYGFEHRLDLIRGGVVFRFVSQSGDLTEAKYME